MTNPGTYLDVAGGISLASLLTSPEVFASIANEIGLGRFLPISGTVTLTPNQVTEVAIPKPNNFVTLVLTARVVVNLASLQFDLVKDDIPTATYLGFTTVDDAILPNLYTPIRNSGVLRFTNLSSLSTLSIGYFVEALQIQVQYWNALRYMLGNLLGDVDNLVKGSRQL